MKHLETTRQTDGSGFWTPGRSSFARQAFDRLVWQAWGGAGTDLLNHLKNEFGIKADTLLHFGCGIDPFHGIDWLLLPYESGFDLVCWVNDLSIGGPTPDSVPEESFFGASALEGSTILFVVEGPIELMLFHQKWASRHGVDGVCLLNGKVFSEGRKRFLKENINTCSWEKIVFLHGPDNPLVCWEIDPWYWILEGNFLTYQEGVQAGAYPAKIGVDISQQTNGKFRSLFEFFRETPENELNQFLSEVSDSRFDMSDS